jgi:hypothetical protein
MVFGVFGGVLEIACVCIILSELTFVFVIKGLCATWEEIQTQIFIYLKTR